MDIMITTRRQVSSPVPAAATNQYLSLSNRYNINININGNINGNMNIFLQNTETSTRLFFSYT